MSRQYDDYIDRFPLDIPEEDYSEHYNVAYRRIKDFPDYYVSSDGEIVSFVKKAPRIMETWKNQYGHLYTRLVSGNEKKTVSIHREVAKAFVPNPTNQPVVRHKNDDPLDNAYSNLKWGTQQDNVQDMREHGRMYGVPVIVDETNIYATCNEAAIALNASKAAITKACKGGIKMLKGHKIRYLNER